MKENMFEVLMYLFENHMKNDCKLILTEETLTAELEQVGFSSDSIDKALDWLEGLMELQESANAEPAGKDSLRIYSPDEQLRLDANSRGFLLFLENIGILNPRTRELVIDRLMAIEDEEIGLPQVKWVTLLVLFNQPNEEAALACMENLVLDQSDGLH